jgi:membrane-associated HD superfamily phosphohydrolase
MPPEGRHFIYVSVCINFAEQMTTLIKNALIVCFLFCVSNLTAVAQCSICTKTAQQLGEGPAKGMNSGILYLAFMPFAIIGYIGYRWWKNKNAA